MKKNYFAFFICVFTTLTVFAQQSIVNPKEKTKETKVATTIKYDVQQPILISFHEIEKINIEQSIQLINKIDGFTVNEFCAAQKGFLCIVNKQMYPTHESLYVAFEKMANHFPKYTINTTSVANSIDVEKCN